jgi:hypothetical protein
MQWEYYCFTDTQGESGVRETLNKLGAKGWELVSVAHEAGVGLMFYLKRQKPD